MKDFHSIIQTEFRQFEQEFAAVLTSDNQLLNDALDYLHSKRGKQLRPVLVLLSAAICKGITSKSIHTAVALELMHTSSLVHDDVVDNSPTRRGDKALHEQWTNKIAILVGDYMLSKSISLLSSVRNNTILCIISEMTAALTSGEILQLHNGQSMWISEEQYLQIIKKKTDEEHYLTTAQLAQILEEQYGITSHRQTIKADIELLKQFGLEIEEVKSVQNRYNLYGRQFDIPELKLLIDAVESSKFITAKKSIALIEKIHTLSSQGQISKLKRNNF